MSGAGMAGAPFSMRNPFSFRSRLLAGLEQEQLAAVLVDINPAGLTLVQLLNQFSRGAQRGQHRMNVAAGLQAQFRRAKNGLGVPHLRQHQLEPGLHFPNDRFPVLGVSAGILLAMSCWRDCSNALVCAWCSWVSSLSCLRTSRMSRLGARSSIMASPVSGSSGFSRGTRQRIFSRIPRSAPNSRRAPALTT